MKKFISKIASAAICTGILLSTAVSASAETISVEPDYPIHGNKCGIIYVKPELDRDVYITITQYTPDGDYVYYNTTIPAASNAAGENAYSFLIEGKDDISYDITIGVPKYKSSNNDTQTYTYTFSILDTDDIVDDVISGYAFYFDLVGGTEFKVPQLVTSEDIPKDENNVIVERKKVFFPLADYTIGDVNFDNSVDLYDAIEIAKYLLDKSYLNKDQLLAGDFDQNGSVDLYDAIAIARTLISK